MQDLPGKPMFWYDIYLRREGFEGMPVTLETLLIVCPLVFIAALVDAIAGGGGIIALPAYLIAGLPVHTAYGTNKFSSSAGTLFSAFRFIKSGRFEIRSAAAAVASAVIGSFLGARLALMISELYLKYCLVVMLPVIAVFVLVKRGFGEQDRTRELPGWKIIVLSIASGFIIGAYDGFFGPGAGTFLILAFTGIIGFTMATAAGNAKLVNLASNFGALFTYLMSGKVLFAVGIPAALCGILGHWIGSGLAIKNGAKIIRPVLSFVFLLLFIKIGIDILY